jgi:hypothetical protein
MSRCVRVHTRAYALLLCVFDGLLHVGPTGHGLFGFVRCLHLCRRRDLHCLEEWRTLDRDFIGAVAAHRKNTYCINRHLLSRPVTYISRPYQILLLFWFFLIYKRFERLDFRDEYRDPGDQPYVSEPAAEPRCHFIDSTDLFTRFSKQ